MFLKFLHISLCCIAGLTNYPIGVGINGAGEVTIADNHNNFNLSVFSQDGKIVYFNARYYAQFFKTN